MNQLTSQFFKFVRQCFRRGWILIPVLVAILLSSCGDKKSSGYIPGKAPTLESFYPQTGKFLDRVMLVGDNFPTDANLVKVYFNARRAPITGSSGTHITALAPRLPGGEEIEVFGSKNKHRVCSISVVVGKDSVTYTGDFIYEETISSITIAGNGDCSELVTGSLQDAIVQPTYLCSDKFGNVFVCNRGDGAFGRNDNGGCGGGRNALLRLNEDEDILEQVGGQTSNAPCADPITGVIMVPTEQFQTSYYICDPLEGWIPRTKSFTWTHDDNLPPNGWKHCMVINPDDGYIYTWYRTAPGLLVKLHPELGEATVIYRADISGDTDCFGLTFREGEPNILYLSFTDNGSSGRSHGIYTMDLSAENPGSTFTRLNAEGSGHRDGPLATALFNCPMQLFKDPDGFIYIADRNNHCIRRITPENMVETVLGMPGNSGYQDGSKDIALFRNPCGIAVTLDGTVYVADGGNNRIRKISIN